MARRAAPPKPPAMVAGALVIASGHRYTIRQVDDQRAWVWAAAGASAWLWRDRLTWDPAALAWRADSTPATTVPGQVAAFPDLEADQ